MSQTPNQQPSSRLPQINQGSTSGSPQYVSPYTGLPPTGDIFPPIRIEPRVMLGVRSPPQNLFQADSIPVTTGIDEPVAKYPPVVRVEPLGYLKDATKPHDSRDIGRSSAVRGSTFYMFGDTFCMNVDNKDEFLGLTCNTAAMALEPRTNPLETTFVSLKDERGLVLPFIELTDSEKRLHEEDASVRVLIWSFGGVVTTEDKENPKSYIWFEKNIERKTEGGPAETITLGTGVARVRVDESTGELRAERFMGDTLLFGPDEPRVGVFCSLPDPVDHSFILWGHRGHSHDLVMMRVRQDLVHDRRAYSFWTGDRWSGNWGNAIPILREYQHGQFFNTTLFGPEKPWVFVGNSSWGDSEIKLAAAERMEGPYDHMYTLHKAKGIVTPDKFIYCVFPHPWAFKQEDGELLVTWSEQWPGGVLSARMHFEMEPRTYWIEMDISRLPRDILAWASQSEEIEQLAALKGVKTKFVTLPLTRKHKMRIEGKNLQAVTEADFEIRRMLERMVNDVNEPVPDEGPLIWIDTPATRPATQDTGRGRRRSSFRNFMSNMFHRRSSASNRRR